MATTPLLLIALALAVSIQATPGEINCENLNEDSCAFAVSSMGNRCVLESRSFLRRLGTFNEYTCRTSEIKASNQLTSHIETDKCISACGVDKKALGISSDSLLDRNFIHTFCSDMCYNSCPNIVDLYFNLAAGEGVFIPTVCERLRSGGRRGMLEIAQAPSLSTAEDILAGALAPAPSSV